MAIRSQSQDVNTDSFFLFAKMSGMNKEETGVYYPPLNDEGSGEEKKGSAFGDDEENGMESGLGSIELMDVKEAVSGSVKAPASGSSPEDNSLLLPLAPGARTIMCVHSMIDYLCQASQQGYEQMLDATKAMIGIGGQKGLIASWVESGMKSAEEAGHQMQMSSIGSMISGGVCLGSVGAMGAGFARNSYGGIGTGRLQTERGAINGELEEATVYRNRLEDSSDAKIITGSKTEKIKSNDEEDAEMEDLSQREEIKTEMTEAVRLRKEQLVRGVNTKPKNASIEEADEIQRAVKSMTPDERIEAQKKADEQIKNHQDRQGRCDNKQQIWSNFTNQFGQAGQSGSQGAGQMAASSDQTDSGIDKAKADAFQQSNQTTDGVGGKASQHAASDLDEMGKMALELAQILAQTQRA